MDFVTAVNNDMIHTYTENGARACNTSWDACLDFFSTIGSLRDTDIDRKIRLFENAYNEDRLSALRILFYGRDVRGGLGERDTFRQILKYAADRYPECIDKNICLVPYYGRWDDLFELIGTKCEDSMWNVIKAQFEADWYKYKEGNNNISLLAKWVKRGDESSPVAKKLGKYTAEKMGYSVYTWKRMVAELRKQIDIVEAKMSTNRWDEINYSSVPSRASMIYRNAFYRHDYERYTDFINAVSLGEETINTGTLYPYDIISKVMNSLFENIYFSKYDATIQALWDNLPNYVEGEHNVLVIADTSGSMTCSNGRPLHTALGLAIYFAQRNKGPFHNLWMTFSNKPAYQKIKGKDLWTILRNIDMHGWNMNTNLEAAFIKVLDTCVKNNIDAKDVPKSIIVISDMEIDACECSGWSFYDEMKDRYAKHGYDIPNIVFWNVASRHDIYHADKSRKGVQLVSGQSASTFKTLMNSIGMTPMEYMYSVINSDRYIPIQIHLMYK